MISRPPLHRILVVAPNWFGEALFITPFIAALREARPFAFIAALSVPRVEEIVRHIAGVDRSLTYDEAGAHRWLAGKWRIASVLRRERFDTAFVLRRSASRTALVWLAGVPFRVGFANRKSRWLLTHPIPPSRGARHKAATYLELLGGLGLPAQFSPYAFRVTEQERRETEAWLHAQGVSGDQHLIVVHPGANWAHKRWSPERFAQAADHLAQRPGRLIALTGAPEDQPLIDKIRSLMSARALILAGRTTVPQMAACLSRAALLVSNDTGVMHLAAAVGCPVVALYGPTSPAMVGPLGDPSRTRVIHHAASCPNIPCYRPEHPGHPGMDAISVEEVVDASERLLDAAGRPA